MPERRRIYATTAMGALSSESAPVGGGVAVLEALLPHLAAEPGFGVTLLCPGPRAAAGLERGVRTLALPVPALERSSPAAMLHAPERDYARFALEWERALASYFAGVDPRGAVVLANDVSEGPPFAELARRGFRQVVLYHVVVGDFFARQYLGGIGAPLAARAWRAGRRLGLARLAPELLALVWEKEEQAARCADAIVPSAPLARALARLYPGSGIAARTRVVPWGVVGRPDPGRRAERETVLAKYGVQPERACLLTLSRISREKRLELVLRALAHLERAEPARAERLALVLAGAPAYMGGEACHRRLQRAAAGLSRVQVRFAGYVGGEAKWDLFAAADLFCSSSSYEAYGLTIAQALASGTPVLATEHQGARAILTPALGHLAPARPRAFARALAELADADLAPMRAAAAAWGAAHPFERAAREIVAHLRGIGAEEESKAAVRG